MELKSFSSTLSYPIWLHHALSLPRGGSGPFCPVVSTHYVSTSFVCVKKKKDINDIVLYMPFVFLLFSSNILFLKPVLVCMT